MVDRDEESGVSEESAPSEEEAPMDESVSQQADEDHSVEKNAEENTVADDSDDSGAGDDSEMEAADESAAEGSNDSDEELDEDEDFDVGALFDEQMKDAPKRSTSDFAIVEEPPKSADSTGASANDGGEDSDPASIDSLIERANQKLGSSHNLSGEETPDDLECWLIRQGGVDYGPFDAETIRKKMWAEEINEHTMVIDSRNGRMNEIIDSPKFADFVMDYIPEREARRLEEQERKEELVSEVKRRGVRATVSVAIGSVVLGFLGLLALHMTGVLKFQDIGETIRPTPVEFPFSQTVRSYRYRFVVPEPDYQDVDVDNSLVASLFAKPSAGGGGGGGGLRSGAYQPGKNEPTVVNFDSSSPAFKLTGQQINSTLSQNVGRIQRCFQGEMRRNPQFKGINLTFSINPDGSTFNVRVSSSGPRSSSLDTCVVRAVRSIRFPQFNDVPMSVSYPFYVQ